MRYLQRQRLVQFRRFDVFRDFTTRQLHTILPARPRARGYLDDETTTTTTTTDTEAEVGG